MSGQEPLDTKCLFFSWSKTLAQARPSTLAHVMLPRIINRPRNRYIKQRKLRTREALMPVQQLLRQNLSRRQKRMTTQVPRSRRCKPRWLHQLRSSQRRLWLRQERGRQKLTRSPASTPCIQAPPCRGSERTLPRRTHAGRRPPMATRSSWVSKMTVTTTDLQTKSLAACTPAQTPRLPPCQSVSLRLPNSAAAPSVSSRSKPIGLQVFRVAGTDHSRLSEQKITR